MKGKEGEMMKHSFSEIVDMFSLQITQLVKDWAKVIVLIQKILFSQLPAAGLSCANRS